MTLKWTTCRTAYLLGICLWLLTACVGENPDSSRATSQADPSTSKYRPTPPHPIDVGEHLAGPRVYTVDARSQDVWLYFDFSRGSVVAVQDPKIDPWDLGFRRHVIRVNGGATNASGRGALASMGEGDFNTVTRVPEDTTFTPDVRTQKRPFPYNPVVHKWYNYSYMANVLVPKPLIYAVRTQDGKYAKIRFLSYYCEGGVSGCMTFEYVYQGDGSRNLTPASSRHQGRTAPTPTRQKS